MGRGGGGKVGSVKCGKVGSGGSGNREIVEGRNVGSTKEVLTLVGCMKVGIPVLGCTPVGWTKFGIMTLGCTRVGCTPNGVTGVGCVRILPNKRFCSGEHFRANIFRGCF